MKREVQVKTSMLNIKAVPGVSSSLLRYFIKAKTSVSKWYCSSLENLDC